MTDADHIEFFEERAAIMEYDGGLSRLEAQRRAYWEWRRKVGKQVKVPEHIKEKASEYLQTSSKSA